MLNYKIEITSLAEQDLEDAADYIAFELKNPVAAVNMVKGIRKQINSLKTFPECNELDEDSILAEFGIRMDYYKNYKIYYVIERDVIIVIRILHMLVNSRVWLYRTLGLNS
ncbi:MAG: type II toxin-antitoxin system RelE/ParE family toxin [Lachnospiraceae bacterium]|nr:type II toxin-antitoxin system RelE/ParE family toxin [Lachnospiraceae bacterium]